MEGEEIRDEGEEESGAVGFDFWGDAIFGVKQVAEVLERMVGGEVGFC